MSVITCRSKLPKLLKTFTEICRGLVGHQCQPTVTLSARPICMPQTSDVKRGQFLETEAEAEDKFSESKDNL